MAIDEEKKRLFKKIRSRLGAPVRKVELTDDQLCDLLEQAVEDYAELVQNFMIENNWAQLYGKDLTGLDVAYALSVRTLDLSKDYSYWFSKEVGLQQRGPYELKKDFFKIEKGKQVYVIPAGREINKVFWVTPPTTDAAMWANFGGLGVNFGGGVMGQAGLGATSIFGGVNSAYGLGVGIWALPFADISTMAADLSYKNQFIRSDLVYKVTAGPNGTHLLHLMSTPGSKLTFGMSNGSAGALSLIGCEVWYTYYDTSDGSEDECMRYHADDVILSFDQVPMNELDFAFLNEPAKVIVRQLFVAIAKQALGNIRGKYSGKVSIPQAEMTLDYQMLHTQGKEEYDKAMENLTKILERMRPVNIIKENAELLENNNKILGYTPLGLYVI